MTVDRFRAEYLKILSEGFLTGGFPVVECDDSLGGYRMRMTMHNKARLQGHDRGQHIVHIGQSGLSRLPVSRFGTHKFDGNSRRTYRQLLLCRPALVLGSISTEGDARSTQRTPCRTIFTTTAAAIARVYPTNIPHRDIPDITTSISALR